MKRAAILLLALLVVPAAQADAKFGSGRVCGPSACREVDVSAERTFLPIVQAAFARGPGLMAKPPEASPWYRVTLCGLRCDSRHALTLRVLPTAGYEYAWRGREMRRRGWAKLNDHAADVYRRVTAELEPFPASRLVALGAQAPDSSGRGGISPLVWIAIAAAAVAVALASARRLRGLRHAAPAR